MQPQHSGESIANVIASLTRPDGVLSRRDAVRILASAGFYSLASGCLPTSSLHASPSSGPSISRGGGDDYPIVIDVHSHIFNVRDVPAAEYFLNSIAHIAELNSGASLAPGQVRFFRELVLHLTNGLSKTTACARDEREALLDLEREGANPFSPEQMRQPPETAATSCSWRLRIRNILRTLPLSEAQHLAATSQSIQVPGESELENDPVCGAPVTFNAANAVDDCGRATLETYADRFPEGVARILVQIERFLFGDRARLTSLAGLAGFREYGTTLNQWLRRMAYPRYEIARELVRTFGNPDGQSGGVDAFVVAMVDMQYWLRSATDPLEDQMLLTRDIARLSGGRLLPFVAYDPLRDIRENGGAFRLVQEAVNTHGFVGVKLYPANGFRPLGNASLDDDFPGVHQGGQPTRDLGRELDTHLHELYAWCADNGVAVMAHGNETMGTYRRYAERGNPMYWGRVAERYPLLRINIGHFGGMESLTQRRRLVRERFGISYLSLRDAPENWTIQILGLMTEHPRIFSDVGAFGGVLKNSGHLNRFKRNLRDLLSGNWYPAGRTQLMYGSDWYMVAASPGAPNYYRRFEELFRTELDSASASAFLGLNAVRFLGLRSGERNRERLDAFYQANAVEGAWRQKVDKMVG